MAYLMFIGSLAICGFVLSFVDLSSSREAPCDYHFVPGAGDVFGA